MNNFKICMCILWFFLLLSSVICFFALIFVIEDTPKWEIAVALGVTILSFLTLKAIDNTF